MNFVQYTKINYQKIIAVQAVKKLIKKHKMSLLRKLFDNCLKMRLNL